MKQTIFKDKYPVWTLKLDKKEIKQKNIKEIIEYFKDIIDSHPVAVFIATFDNYAHTKSIGGSINETILGMQNIIFCFGKEIPSTKVAAVRPRSIGVCEVENEFIIEFMEAPNEGAHKMMEDWAKRLKI